MRTTNISCAPRTRVLLKNWVTQPARGEGKELFNWGAISTIVLFSVLKIYILLVSEPRRSTNSTPANRAYIPGEICVVECIKIFPGSPIRLFSKYLPCIIDWLIH